MIARLLQAALAARRALVRRPRACWPRRIGAISCASAPLAADLPCAARRALVLLARRRSCCGRWPGRWQQRAGASARPRRRCSAQPARPRRLPAVFGVDAPVPVGAGRQGTSAFRCVLLPAPSAIWAKLVDLAADPRGRFRPDLRARGAPRLGRSARLPASSSRSSATAVPFLRRGLLPLGNLVAALPIVGIAPIMVMWFGFDWHSKVAVVVIMTFFPMLVNTVAGLAGRGPSRARSHALLRRRLLADTLVKLRLPAAMPFIFNALKINSTLALIGAIVAEFFGTPDRRHGLSHLDRGRPARPRHGLGRDRGRGARRLGFLRCCSRSSSARSRSGIRPTGRADEPMDTTGRGEGADEEILMMAAAALRGAGGGHGRRLGRERDAAAQMGHPGAVRRLLRRPGARASTRRPAST